MRQALYILERTAILTLGVAVLAAAQAPPPPARPGGTPTQPSAKPGAAPAATPSKTQSAAKPAVAVPKPVAQAPAAKPKPVPAKPNPSPAKAPATKKEVKKTAQAEAPKKEEAPAPVATTHRRDPFLALISVAAAGGGPPVRLPAGPAGLQVSTLRVEGVVRSPNGMLAVVTNPQGRTYFLHQGARVFDGRVEQISMDSVTFQETGKDPFGKPIDRTVVKRIYPSAGEQQ
jgi:type IV pilus assembly protein PilP